MVLSNFRARVLARVLIFAALAVVLAWSVPNTRWLVTPIACGILMLVSMGKNP